jgi:hypothetical protein
MISKSTWIKGVMFFFFFFVFISTSSSVYGAEQESSATFSVHKEPQLSLEVSQPTIPPYGQVIHYSSSDQTTLPYTGTLQSNRLCLIGWGLLLGGLIILENNYIKKRSAN